MVSKYEEPTLRGVTTDQRMAERRRERSQKKAERIRIITCKYTHYSCKNTHTKLNVCINKHYCSHLILFC